MRLLSRAVSLTQILEPLEAFGYVRQLILVDALKHLQFT
jgi:hypothetical protein